MKRTLKQTANYRVKVGEILDAIAEKEQDAFAKAADILSDAVIAGKLINVFGAGGHSAVGAMEIFWRAGGLVQVNAMFPPGTNIVNSYPTLAKVTGAAPFILNFYRVNKGDVLVLINFYGLNPISVDVAIEAKKRGVTLITVNSHKFAAKVPADFKWRHPSKKNIHDMADVKIDNHVPYPDAVLKLDGVEENVTPTATIATCFALNCMMSETIQRLVDKGHKPDVWISNNIPGCDEHNVPMVEKYRGRIHHLYPPF